MNSVQVNVPDLTEIKYIITDIVDSPVIEKYWW